MAKFYIQTPDGNRYYTSDLKRDLESFMAARKLPYVFIAQGWNKMEWYIVTWDWLQDALKEPDRQFPIIAVISSNPTKRELGLIASKKSFNELCEDIMEKVDKLISEAEKNEQVD
jgi:hypothetical protein